MDHINVILMFDYVVPERYQTIEEKIFSKHTGVQIKRRDCRALRYKGTYQQFKHSLRAGKIQVPIKGLRFTVQEENVRLMRVINDTAMSLINKERQPGTTKNTSLIDQILSCLGQ